MHHPEDDEALIRESSPCSMSTTNTPAWSNHELVAQIRRCGREAGKRLGYQIRTLTSDPLRLDNRRVAVWVIVISSNPDDEDRLRERSELLINQTLNQLLG